MICRHHKPIWTDIPRHSLLVRSTLYVCVLTATRQRATAAVSCIRTKSDLWAYYWFEALGDRFLLVVLPVPCFLVLTHSALAAFLLLFTDGKKGTSCGVTVFVETNQNYILNPPDCLSLAFRLTCSRTGLLSSWYCPSGPPAGSCTCPGPASRSPCGSCPWWSRPGRPSR